LPTSYHSVWVIRQTPSKGLPHFPIPSVSGIALAPIVR